MTAVILAHPAMTRTMPLADAVASACGAGNSAPLLRLWRSVPAGVIGDRDQAELRALLCVVRPLRVEHWREALAGDPAAAVAAALKLSGLDVLDTPHHDVVMSMVLLHALAGSDAARTTLAFVLQRRRYLGEDVESLIASWRKSDRVAIRRASIQALMEALS
ncbi:hypothetical protein ACXIUS_20050 [Bosea thiooxidans]